MATQPEYLKDITEIRTMMERSTKFLSLTGLSGIMAGVYALAGAILVYVLCYDNALHPGNSELQTSIDYTKAAAVAAVVLVLTLVTALLLSYRKSAKTQVKLWNAAARRLLVNMMIPLAVGGILILILFSKGIVEYTMPMMLLFYGLALVNASKFSYEEFKFLGLIEIALGLTAAYLTDYGLLFWAIGFGVMHIIYGIYMHLSFEK